MFHIFVLLALAGQPAAILESHTAFDTKEACEAARPAMIERLEAEIKPQYPDASVTKSVCSDKEDGEEALKE